MHWVLTVLAVFWAWETLLAVVPDRVPAALHPLLVAGLAYGAAQVDDVLLTAAAVAGAVGILHVLARLAGASTPDLVSQIRLPRRSHDPLPRGVGQRVPNLP